MYNLSLHNYLTLLLFDTSKYTDKELLRTHGLDAVMFIKFIKMMISISIIGSLYGFVVLFAVNGTGEHTVSIFSVNYLLIFY